MDFFLNEILTDKAVIQTLKEQNELREQAAAIAASLLQGEKAPSLQPGMLPLLVLGELAPHAMKKHQSLGIPHEVTVATLQDVNLWIENHYKVHGSMGVMEFHWLLRHYLTADLFRLGRLQFQRVKNFAGAPGEYAIETHIPQGEPLKMEACLDSFARAKSFYDRFFPQHSTECFVCHSWLLCPNLADVLEEDTNIIRFMRLWNRIPCEPDHSAQTMERVFGFGFCAQSLPDAPENTNLQRKIKRYLLSGGSLDAAAGYLKSPIIA